MAKEDETSAQPWGTLEELLLACAVNRHGTESWDCIAMEVQNRTTTLRSLTTQNCIDKFNDLKRRFMPPQNDAASDTSLVYMVDELRRIRVEELRREVQRYDVSIVSLEMKVKRLEEDRERSLREEADLAREKKKPLTGTTAAGDDSIDERENRSFNESNSTSQQKAETTMVKEQNDTVGEEPDIKFEPESKTEPDPVGIRTDPETKQVWPRNGKLDDENDENGDKKVADDEENKITPGRVGRLGESNELGESVGESRREEKGKKEQNSDVQSSASLSLKKKQRRRRRGVGVGNSSGEEPGIADEVSPAMKRVSAVKSEPLLKLLGIIRSHRLGSVFERRLRSQESQRYKNLIRQHIDLQMVQSRLDEGVYSNCIQMFFRDLLLLFNNAIIFFRKNSPENRAANELRAVVCKEMKEKPRKPKPQVVRVPVKLEPERQPASFSMPNKISTMIACGTRSSETSSKKGNKKNGGEVEENPNVNKKKIESSFTRTKGKGMSRQRTYEMLLSGHGNSTSNRNGEIKHQYGGNELSSHDALEIKVDMKGRTGRKRKVASRLLGRMKQNSPREGTDNDDDSLDDEGEDSRVEEKKIRGRNGDGTRERVTRSSRGRSAREESTKVKRIGRPPKRQATSKPELGGGTQKRGRDDGDSEVGIAGPGRARKRSRR